MHKSNTFHNDPGNGWLEVLKSDLEVLGVAQSITPFSIRTRRASF